MDSTKNSIFPDNPDNSHWSSVSFTNNQLTSPQIAIKAHHEAKSDRIHVIYICIITGYIYFYLYIYIYIFIYIFIYIYIYIYIYLYIFIYIFLYLNIFIYIFIFIYLYIYKPSGKRYNRTYPFTLSILSVICYPIKPMEFTPLK